MNFDVTPALAKLQAMIQGLIALLPNLFLSLLVLVFFFFVAKWGRKLIEGFCNRKGHQLTVGLVIGRLGSAVIMLLGLLVSLSIILPSFKAVDLIQVLGLSSVAIGFAFRDVLQNFLAGILILLAQPFRVGEEIAVDDYEGVVMEIQARATLIKTWDGYLVVIPNATIYTQTITVFNAYDARRTNVDFVIGSGKDVERARELMVEAISEVEGVLQDPPPGAIVTGVSDYGITISARWWTDAKRKDNLTVRDRVIPVILRKLTEHDIDLPYPTHQILLHDQTANTNGNRSAPNHAPIKQAQTIK